MALIEKIYNRLELHHLNIHFACSYSYLEAFGFTVIYRFTEKKKVYLVI